MFVGSHIKYCKVMGVAVQVIMSLSLPASSPLSLKYGTDSLSRNTGLKLSGLIIIIIYLFTAVGLLHSSSGYFTCK